MRRGEVNEQQGSVSLTTGLEDPEKVTVAFLVAVAAAEQGRPTLMFLTKEAVRLALPGIAQGVACEGCPPLAELTKRYEVAGGRLLVCPICFNSRHLEDHAGRQRRHWAAPSRCGSGSATSQPPRSATDTAERQPYQQPRRAVRPGPGRQGRRALRAVLADAIDFQALTPRTALVGQHARRGRRRDRARHVVRPRGRHRGAGVADPGRVPGREHVSYLLRVRNDDGEHLVEQQAYYNTDGAQISWMRVLCSGYQPLPRYSGSRRRLRSGRGWRRTGWPAPDWWCRSWRRCARRGGWPSCGDDQPLGDLPVRQAAGEQPEHLDLAAGQARPAWPACGSPGARRR